MPATHKLDDVQRRAADLQHLIDTAPDEPTAATAADELHALMDQLDNIVEIHPHRLRRRR